jgi:hypothetical protein
VVAIDISDPSKPHEVARWNRPSVDWDVHGVTVGPDGKRLYVVAVGAPVRMAILDVSAVQARTPGATIRAVSELTMDGTGMGQFAEPVTISGKPYVVAEAIHAPLVTEYAARCGHDWYSAPYATPSLIDISDETKPRAVGYMRLEINDPGQCSTLVHDPTYLGYGNLQCTPDDPLHTKMLACAYGEAGVRVIDVRDPMRPREIAYYKPAPVGTLLRKGSYFGEFGSGFVAPAAQAQIEQLRKSGQYRPPTNDHTADATLFVRFMNGGREIGFVSGDGGFHIVRFSDQVIAAERELFSRAAKAP